MKQIILVRGVLIQKGKLLLIQRAEQERSFPGHYELPGGKVDAGEDPVEALEREFWEETGIQIQVGTPIQTLKKSSQDHHLIEIVYHVSADHTTVTLSEDHQDVRWVQELSEIEGLQITPEDYQVINPFLKKIMRIEAITHIQKVEELWGDKVVSRGRVHHTRELSGFQAILDNEPVGFITYHQEGDQWEIVTLDSIVENQGVGRALLEHMIVFAKSHNGARLWLITSNDNVHALRFYQKRGFEMCAIHLDAITEARKIKPTIPIVGLDGIPIRHELELEYLMNLSHL
ncbi:GNAT family N-acetyltransferase [Risungbinella massiliensis]|uniref:GNAT family N-acetyltransferase n=1 Tax=Risungbinella massiliensis TaxID=1329796 RepID=UPI00164D70D5|nr:GNAT family N-acetyltransferase [Risungbinella massiliensis]